MSAADLLDLLRRTRLLGHASLARLAAGWPADAPAEECAAQLLAAGLVTPFQADEILAGRGRRLRVGPYRLLDRLGGGGGGTVYKAEHTLLGRVVALKVMRRGGVAAGRREARAAATLAHPNIVAAKDAGVWRGRLVLALEYADGIDLGRLVREGGPLPVPLAVEAARQALVALDHLHRRGLVHRDVKPSNLVLVRGGADGPPLVKLLDLGLARAAGKPDRRACGTPDFQAPERGGGGPLDIRSDLWSLGCTLHLLLTGQLPFGGETPANRYLSRKLDDPVRVRSLRPEVPPHIEALILRLLARDPDERPADPASALALFDPPPPPKRRSARPMLAAVLLGLLAGGAARIAVEPPPDTPPPAVTRPAAKPSVRVEGVGDFATLGEALGYAPAVITLTGPGPFRAEGLSAADVTIRAAPGPRPVLEAGGDGWEPMLSGGSVELEGVLLRAGGGPAAMVQATRRLVMRRCVLASGRDGPAAALRRGVLLRLEDCRIDANGQGLSAEAGDEGRCAVELLGSDVRVSDPKGAAAVLWGGRGPLSLSVTGGSLRAGRTLASHARGPVRLTGITPTGALSALESRAGRP